MKKITLITLIIFPILLSGQNFPFVKEGAIWRVAVRYLINPPNNFGLDKIQYAMLGDTIILGKTYKKVYSANYDSLIFNKAYIGAMREDSIGRVFFFEDSTNQPGWWYISPLINNELETILYDFSLAVNDTFLVHNNPDSVQIVTSIDSVQIASQWRKRINFNITGMSNRVWIEGIGDMNGLFFPAVWVFENYNLLTCYEDSLIFWTHPELVNSGINCFSVGIEENNSVPNNLKLKVFPNPSSAEVTISLSNGLEMLSCVLLIYDSHGKKVKKDIFPKAQTSIELNISELKAGIYYIQYINDKMIISDKLIFE